jgi:hypothetical protein
MTYEIPRADYYYVGLHKTGSTFLGTRLFPLFDDTAVRLTDHTEHGSFFEWEAPLGPVALLKYNSLSGAPDSPRDDRCKDIHAVNSNAKIVISIRSQTTMLRSIYWLCVKTGDVRSFEQFAADVIANGKLDYHGTVERYRKVFGRRNVLVLLFEELTQSPHETIEKLACFFGVATPAIPDQKPQPVKVTPGDLEIGMRRRLNARATRHGHDARHLAMGASGRTLIAATHWGELAYRWITGERLNLIHLKDQERCLNQAFAASNRRLFASLSDSPSVRNYPGMEQGKVKEEPETALASQDPLL